MIPQPVLCLVSFLTLILGAQPEPEARAQKDAEARIRARFAEKYAKRSHADLRALAYELFEEAAGPGGEPAARFVLLRETADLAAQGGDAETAFDAIDELAREFEVDGLQRKLAALSRAERAVQGPEDARALAEGAFGLFRGLIEKDDFEEARNLSRRAAAWAKQAQSAALAARAQEYQKELSRLHGESVRVKGREKTLSQKPGDPVASSELGRFLCAVKGNWEKGVPLLVKGPDGPLRTVAAKEEGGPADPAGAREVGELWSRIAEKEGGPFEREEILRHALSWYARAGEKVPDLERQVAPREAKVVLGKRVRSKGLSPRPHGDGLYQAVFLAGKPCVRLDRKDERDRARYLYFDIADDWAALASGQEIELEIECYDNPPGPFTVEYNSQKSSYRGAPKPVTLSGKSAWKVIRLDLPEALFRNAQNARSDLRIRREPGAALYVHRVTVRRVEDEPGARKKK